MLEELVYSAAQRALDQQSTSLSDLRTRTSNKAVIGRREFIFRLALLTLGAETLLWALALALT
jgi:hypothetical protein